LFNAQRPAVLNGIEDFVNRPDLADRTIFLTLEPIPEEKRKADQALQDEFDRVRPQLLGALLNLVVIGLQCLPRTKIARLPRMADFALWGTACEREPGVFMRAYEANRSSAVEVILEADLVATAVRALMKNRGGAEWSGSASKLLTALNINDVLDESLRRGRDWPTRPGILSGRLRRAATNLRKAGIEVSFDRTGHSGARAIRITETKKGRKSSSATSAAAASAKTGSGGRGMDADDSADDVLTTNDLRHDVSANPLKTGAADDADDADDELRTQSAAPDDEPVCRRCGVPGNATHGQLIRAGQNGAAGHYHPRCWTEERTRPSLRDVPADRRPALGPVGDSLDDLQ